MKKHFRSFGLLLLIASLVLSLTSCGWLFGDDDGGGGSSENIIIPSTTIVLDESTTQYLSSISEDGVISPIKPT